MRRPLSTLFGLALLLVTGLLSGQARAAGPVYFLQIGESEQRVDLLDSGGPEDDPMPRMFRPPLAETFIVVGGVVAVLGVPLLIKARLLGEREGQEAAPLFYALSAVGSELLAISMFLTGGISVAVGLVSLAIRHKIQRDKHFSSRPSPHQRYSRRAQAKVQWGFHSSLLQ